MSNQITTADELDACLDGWASLSRREQVYNGNQAIESLVEQVREYLAHQPTEATQPSVEQVAEALRIDEHQLDRARAVLAVIPAQRCAPSEDEIAEALHADACPEDPDDGEACTCGDYRREAQIVRTLFAGQPTVAQMKAESLREAAKTIVRMADQGADGEASPYETADWLRDRADRIESEAGR